MSRITTKQKRWWCGRGCRGLEGSRKKKAQTNGTLALSRVIREGYKLLPLISPDRSELRPFQSATERHSHTQTHTPNICMNQTCTCTLFVPPTVDGTGQKERLRVEDAATCFNQRDELLVLNQELRKTTPAWGCKQSECGRRWNGPV